MDSFGNRISLNHVELSYDAIHMVCPVSTKTNNLVNLVEHDSQD